MKVLFCSLIGVFASVSAFGQTAFSTFGPGDSYNGAVGYAVGMGQDIRVAAQFTASASGTLGSVRFAHSADIPGTLNVLLYHDDNDALGPMIVGWGTSTGPVWPGTITTLNNMFPFLSLTAGNKYWLEVRGTAAGEFAFWNHNNQVLAGRTYSFSPGTGEVYYDNTLLPAFEVNVVPEPASMAALGLGALAVMRKRRSRA